MTMKPKLAFTLVLMLLLASLLAACSTSATTAPATTAASATTAAVSGQVTTAAATGQATTAPAAGTTAAPTSSSGVLNIPYGTTTFQRNFNPFVASPLYLTFNGIYEPLMINNTAKGEIVPWLATAYKWGTDNKTLTFTIRENVKWSDGQPLTAKDVAYTFNLLKDKAGLQGPGIQAVGGASAYVDSVTASDDKTLVFNFKQAFTPGLYDIISQMIVPEHVWKEVADPSKSTNDNPVGSGPFTQIASFQAQAYQVDKNPNYWQAGKPSIQGIRMSAYAGNDQMALALANGQIDWTGIFIPDIEKVYVSKNPANYGYWFPLTGAMVMLMLNTTKKPFDDVNVRKGISYALNRQQMVTVAESGYTKPADVTGLSEGYTQFKVGDPAKLGDWTGYNATKANQLLDAANLKKGSNGMRQLPDGTPMKFTLNTVTGFTDWIAAAQIIVQNLKAVGIEVTVTQTDFAGYLGNRQKGNFEMTIGTTSGATPYQFYRNAMAKTLLKPIGEVAAVGNFQRYEGGKADELLTQFTATSEIGKQKEIAAGLQQVFADEAPLLPLFSLPQWYEYNSTRFEGFPTKDNPYVVGTVASTGQDFPGQLIVMTTLKPK